MSHPHVWREWQRDALAFYSKRDDGQTNDVIWIRGIVDRCMFCEELQIRPHGRGLSIVRVVLVKEADVPVKVKEAA